jgi:hypothetical protein
VTATCRDTKSCGAYCVMMSCCINRKKTVSRCVLCGGGVERMRMLYICILGLFVMVECGIALQLSFNSTVFDFLMTLKV